MVKDIEVPVKVEDINCDWFSKILKVPINHSSFERTENAQAGTGFLSNMSRVSFQTEDEENKCNFIVKLLPDEGQMRELVISEGFDKNEIMFYQKIRPDLIEKLPEIEDYFCPYIFSKIQVKDETTEHKSVLVLEDLKPLGYHTLSFATKISHDQIWQIVEFLAKLHFASNLLEFHGKVSLSEMYPFLQKLENVGEDSLFYKMAANCFYHINNLLTIHGDEELIQAYNKLEPYALELLKLVQDNGKRFCSMVHGDLWSNNMLFNKDPAIHPKVIDFQLVGVSSSAYDLAVTIISCLPKEDLNKENVAKYLKGYYKAYSEYCDKYKIDKIGTWDEFEDYFYTYGITYTFLWFSLDHTPFTQNIPKLVEIYKFFHRELLLTEFLAEKLITERD